VLRCGGIEIDPARRQVTRDGHLVPLTPREFAVLEHLARHVGRVVPKHELLDAVWGWERDRSPAVAEVYVGYLRRKLDAPFGGSALQTVRGVGYELIDDRG
jgi:two-component system OmpR family response regulator